MSTQTNSSSSRPAGPKTLQQRTVDTLRDILPVVVINSMFPNHMVEEEVPGKSWKVRLGEGHLHIDGQVFNLLENSKDRRFSGGGGIDAWMVMSGRNRKDGAAFRDAVAALRKKFLPFLDDPKLSVAEKSARLDKLTISFQSESAASGKARTIKGPAEFLDKAIAEQDVAATRNYLIQQRGLPESLVDQAMAKEAVYAARAPSHTPGREGSLNIIFPLVNYRTKKRESYSRRSVFGTLKKNQGDKTNSGFIIGSLEKGTTALFVVESPIEGLSRYTILSTQLKDHPDLLSRCCVVGVNGSGRQGPLLEAARDLGVTTVFAGYNNDAEGRKFNRNLIEDAKALGLEAIEDLVPGGEIRIKAYKHAAAAASLKEWREAASLLPFEKIEDGPKHESYQVPNRRALCDLESKIRKARIGYHVVTGGNSPDLIAASKQLVEIATKQHNLAPVVKADQEGWKVSIEAGEKTQEMLNIWRNDIRNCPSLRANPEALQVDFLHLVEAKYINKDWNDEVKGRPGTMHPKFADPGIDIPAEVQRSLDLSRAKSAVEIARPE